MKNFKAKQSLSNQDHDHVMKLNLPFVVAISCLVPPLASIAQNPLLSAGVPKPAPAPSVAVTGRTNTPILWNQIGAKAGADYKGDGLAVSPTPQGARLRCVFQRLDGEAMPESLWMTLTATNSVNDRVSVTAIFAVRPESQPAL
jgi:hypothetical protein